LRTLDVSEEACVGNGLAEVGFLGVLTIIVLPGCLFTLLALLDRFERNLDPDAQTPPTLVKPELAVAATQLNDSGSAELKSAGLDTAGLDDDSAGGDVVPLPLPVTVTEAPAAATG
jgi:hypothetical protein